VVTGGVVSGLGKGVTISSMGRLLQGCGLNVTAIKIDPYLNVDAGTMSPFEHGEVFVLEDGGESDLDLGNYERFLNINLTSDHNITTGKIYRKVILKERRGDYLGKTVQVVPHISNEIQDWIERVSKIPVNGSTADVCLIEVGGTVGDIESAIFLEALRQFQFRVGHDNFLLCFVSLVPIISDEQKTKPTQHGVKALRSLGLSPTVIFCRCTHPLEEATKQKISDFCHVKPSHVLSVHDVRNVYQVPALLESQNLHKIVGESLQIQLSTETNLGPWKVMADSFDNFENSVTIALIGKYTGLQDSYLSVIKALKHAAIACSATLNLEWVEATHLEKKHTEKCNKSMATHLKKQDENGITIKKTRLSEDADKEAETEQYAEAWKKVKEADGVIVPGGFGNRGFLGKTLTAEYCRINKKPYLGVCLGFQAMVVEYSRNILGWTDANSAEFNKEASKQVVIFMPEIDKDNMGGTMRLGARKTKFTHKHQDGSGSITQCLYGSEKKEISERHRHRYEVNPEHADEIHMAGLKFVGRDETGTRMEVAELPRMDHPYYVGCQYHPEFQSRPLQPSPPFYGLLLASTGGLDEFLRKKMKEPTSS